MQSSLGNIGQDSLRVGKGQARQAVAVGPGEVHGCCRRLVKQERVEDEDRSADFDGAVILVGILKLGNEIIQHQKGFKRPRMIFIWLKLSKGGVKKTGAHLS